MVSVVFSGNNYSRGGSGGRPRGRAGANRGREPLRFDGDFDFESSNAQFDKENIEKELKKLTINDGEFGVLRI